jgi:organic hydroperoxide reductase OsmC/OhrA
MSKAHHYSLQLNWTGNKGEGTRRYRSYARDYTVELEGKPPLPGSADPAFLGDATRHNPEDLFLASVSSCHMLWYLHLCSTAGIIVTAYRDEAEGVMDENPDGSGQFSSVTLKPFVTITDPARKAEAKALHDKVGALCFIARSINVPILHEVTILAEE